MDTQTLPKQEPSVQEGLDNALLLAVQLPLSTGAMLVQHLLDEGADVTTRDTDGLTALHICADTGQASIAKLLLKAGCPVDSRAKAQSGWTPLHMACRNNVIDVAELLLAAGADPDAQDVLGGRPVHSAILGNHLPVIKLLVKHGADLTLGVKKLSLPTLQMAAERLLNIFFLKASPILKDTNFWQRLLKKSIQK